MSKAEYIQHLELRLRAMDAALASAAPTGSDAPFKRVEIPSLENLDNIEEVTDSSEDEVNEDQNHSREVSPEGMTPVSSNSSFLQFLPEELPPPPREATSHFFHSIPQEMTFNYDMRTLPPEFGVDLTGKGTTSLETLSPQLPLSDETISGDAISLTIKLRDSTTYFDDIARRRGTEKFDVVDVSIDGDDNYVDTMTDRTVGASFSATHFESIPWGVRRQRRSSTALVADVLAENVPQDAEIAALVAGLERLGMNPSLFRLRLLRKLVPREATRVDLLQYFFENMMWAPVIHPGTFFATLDHQSPLLIYSMYALSTTLAVGAVGSPEWRAQNLPGLPSAHEGERYFSIARRLLTFSLEEPCLSTVLSLVFMSLYATGSGRVSLGWMYGGMSVRMILEMKWHEAPDAGVLAQLTPLEFESRKRAWWFVFYFDTLSSMIAGRPSLIDPCKCYVDFPNDIEWNNLDDSGYPRNSVAKIHRNIPNWEKGLESAFGLVPVMTSSTLQQKWPSKYAREQMMMSVIFGKVASYAKSEKSSRTSIGHLDDRLCQLDSELKEFWTGLSDDAKKEYIPHTDPNGSVSRSELRTLAGSACLHVLYHATVILLHRPELTLHDFVWPTRTSFDVCTHAANRVAAIIERLLVAEPTLRYFNACLTFPVFETCMVHLMNALVSTMLPTSHPFPDFPNAELLRTSRRSVAILIKALDALRRFWASADAYYATVVRVAFANGIIQV
ncbi:hypothetical protein HDU93_006695 [Gonapodya sp. JEL0774]|nr:hypothetical protein HDU93_006695 [Gonapodya sp. JEL0774]